MMADPDLQTLQTPSLIILPLPTRRQTSRAVGEKVEELAERFLKDKGLVPVTRNYHAYRGEIDLVMLDPLTDPTCLVFVEVRFRSRLAHGSGAASVTWHKQQRIIHAARRFRLCHPRWRQLPCRFDVVSATRQKQQTSLQWIKRAFDAS